jgi:hypothetical protein
MTPANMENTVKKRDIKHVTRGPFPTPFSHPFLMERKFAA